MTWTWIAVVVGCVSVLIVGVALLVGRLLHDLGTDQPIAFMDVERLARLRHWDDHVRANRQHWDEQVRTDRREFDDQIRAELDRARRGKPS